MISKTKIFNMALNELGVSAPIENADAQDDSRAIILRNFYEIARDEVLKSFDWNFAEKYRELTPSMTECLDPRYNYVYDYPNDCLSAREVFEKIEMVDDKSVHFSIKGYKKQFKMSSDNNGQKVILANVSPAILRYTRKVDKENQFEPEYITALSMYLAGLTGKAITGSQEKANEAYKKYWDKVRLGAISNATEGQEVDEDNSTYLDVR